MAKKTVNKTIFEEKVFMQIDDLDFGITVVGLTGNKIGWEGRSGYSNEEEFFKEIGKSLSDTLYEEYLKAKDGNVDVAELRIDVTLNRA